MTSNETQNQFFADWPMSHAKRVTQDNRLISWPTDYFFTTQQGRNSCPRLQFLASSLHFYHVAVSLKCQWRKYNWLFERLFKVKKHGVFFFGISFFVLEIFTFLYYANEGSDDIISGFTKTVQHSINNISRNIGAVFFKLVF